MPEEADTLEAIFGVAWSRGFHPREESWIPHSPLRGLAAWSETLRELTVEEILADDKTCLSRFPCVAARARAKCAEPSRRHEATRRGAAGEGVHQRISELSRDLPELVDSAARGAGADGRQS